MTQSAVAEAPPPNLHVLPPPAPASSGLKKLSFGKIATVKAETKTTYPVFPDANGEAAIIAARIIDRVEQLAALESAVDVDKGELRLRTRSFYFTTNHGRHDVPSSVAVNSPKGEVLVTFQSRCAMLKDETPVQEVLGAELTGKFFRQAFEFKIAGDKLPSDKAQEFVNELQELMESYGCADALEVKSSIKPTTEFHAARHLELTTEQNLALDEACPIIAMVKTKGRKK